jgi:hypothetical protein
MAVVIQPAGSGVAGAQPKGITQQYQKAATASNVDTSTGITPMDTGNILGTVPPGKPGIKLVSGVVQRSNQILCDATPGKVGNAITQIAGVGVAVPVDAAGTHASDGLSAAPWRE